ncbi:ABC-type multidrug transport system, permease component [Lachnospiraceae bacterium KM106-2]|nr:ABC-type multidrug transport system, permease component [Lachnospiraceae bacterium KM106-2]
MRSWKKLFQVEGKLMLRCPDSIFFGVIMPVGIFCLIAVIAGNKVFGSGSYTLLETSYASLITVGICATAFMGFPLTVSGYREKKILKHFCVTPVSPMILLLVEVALQLLLAVISAGVITLIAVIGFHYHMRGSVIGFILSYLLVTISMYSIGMMIASVSRNMKTANVVCSFVYFPMLFLSGATIPFEIMPRFLQNIASVLPLTQGIKLLKGFTLGISTGNMILPAVIMIIVAIVCQMIAVKTFRWE